MNLLFLILIIIASVALAFFVLVQNPKGGGLAGNIAGFSNQFMGVKQTTDVLEKGTWIFAVVVGLLCILSALFINSGSKGGSNVLDKLNTNPVNTTTPVTPGPANTNPAGTTTLPGADSIKK